MATANPTLSGPGWQLIVADGDGFALTIPIARPSISLAIGAIDEQGAPVPPAADIIGHSLCPGRDGMTRAIFGPGPVYGRCAEWTALLALNAWSPAS